MSEKKNIVRAAGVLALQRCCRASWEWCGIWWYRVCSEPVSIPTPFSPLSRSQHAPPFLRRGGPHLRVRADFSEVYTQKGEREARELANTCFTLLTIVMAGVTILGIVFSPQIIALMFPGFKAFPSKFELTIFLNRLMFPTYSS